MKNKLMLSLMALLFTFGIQGCQEDKSENTARVQLRLVDASGAYEKVNVEITDIQYRSSEEDSWNSFSPDDGYPINVDLTELVAGNDLLLADEIIPAGMFGQIRLVLSDNNNIVLKGKPDLIHLDTPSAEQSGLKLQLNTELEAGFSYTFILDWDVQKSIVKAGNSGKYNLKPVIRVNAEVNSGSVTGTILAEGDPDEMADPEPLEGAIAAVYTSENIYVTETGTDDSGKFLVQGLKPGNYKIIIDETYYDTFSSDMFTVEAGQVNNLGDILLTWPVEEE